MIRSYSNAMSAPPTTSIEATLLFKLRLVVARFGEMDLAGWWNTRGVLGRLGKAGLSRGFLVTHNFAQARIVFAVATARCKEVYSATDCFTLWNLPPETEEILEANWHTWCRSPEAWAPFFDQLTEIKPSDLGEQLVGLSLIDEAARTAVHKLKPSPHDKSVQLSNPGKLDNQALIHLAAGFSCGAKGQLVVPYIKSR